MHHLRIAALVVAGLLLTLLSPALPESHPHLGPADDTTIVTATTQECPGTNFHNHDDSLEGGYCWQYGGIVPPYYGAFAEGFDLGCAQLTCASLWVTQNGYWDGQTFDLYVWDGGVTGPPGEVLVLCPDQQMESIPYWPTFGRNDLPLSADVSGEFSLGYWAHFADCPCGWYIGSDMDGPGGFPWTCVVPGIGYPSGWQSPEVIWGFLQSLGVGGYFIEEPSPVVAPSWGAVRHLFR